MADFIQDPHPRPQQHALLDPLLVIVRSEFLPCLSVTLSNIISVLIYPATFVS